jgi:hypothetical protein
MFTKLKKHIARSKDDDEQEFGMDDDDVEIEDTTIDPRWEGLQNIIDNN